MTDTLIKIGAVLVLTIGAIYPLIAMVGMVRRINRPGATPMSPYAMMVRLLLIATVPLAGILGGFAGLLPAVWESFVLRVVILAATAASIIGFIALAVLNRMERSQPPANDPKEETASHRDYL